MEETLAWKHSKAREEEQAAKRQQVCSFLISRSACAYS